MKLSQLFHIRMNCVVSLSEPTASLHLYSNRPFRLCWIIRTITEVLPSSGEQNRFKLLTADVSQSVSLAGPNRSHLVWKLGYQCKVLLQILSPYSKIRWLWIYRQCVVSLDNIIKMLFLGTREQFLKERTSTNLRHNLATFVRADNDCRHWILVNFYIFFICFWQKEAASAFHTRHSEKGGASHYHKTDNDAIREERIVCITFYGGMRRKVGQQELALLHFPLWGKQSLQDTSRNDQLYSNTFSQSDKHK